MNLARARFSELLQDNFARKLRSQNRPNDPGIFDADLATSGLALLHLGMLISMTVDCSLLVSGPSGMV